jgi:hypothetical protein
MKLQLKQKQKKQDLQVRDLIIPDALAWTQDREVTGLAQRDEEHLYMLEAARMGWWQVAHTSGKPCHETLRSVASHTVTYNVATRDASGAGPSEEQGSSQ